MAAKLRAASPEVPRAQIDDLVQDLAHKGLLSDARTADAVLHAKAPRYGVRRLRQVLQARALPAALIDETLQRAQASEFERACAAWRRRFGVPAVDARTHAQQMRFLLARGFTADIAQRVLRTQGGDGDGGDSDSDSDTGSDTDTDTDTDTNGNGNGNGNGNVGD